MASRRSFIAGACSAAAVAFSADAVAFSADAVAAAPNLGGAGGAAAPAADLKSITTGVQAISAEERLGRIARLQMLMIRQKIGALLVESGSSFEYFTGISWRRSERTTAAIIPANGAVLVVTPAFEEPSVRETLQVGGDVRIWNEPENPFEKIAEGLRDRGVAAGVIAVEPTVRFFIVDGVRRASAAYRIVSGDALVRACRLVKSPAELTAAGRNESPLKRCVGFTRRWRAICVLPTSKRS
jgi:Xaa-Pro dipeptidase